MKMTHLVLVVASSSLLSSSILVKAQNTATDVSTEVHRTELSGLVAAGGTDYKSARDALIANLDADFPVARLASDSSELGLAAFIVNMRRNHAELFDGWEKQPRTAPSHRSTDSIKKWTRDQSAAVAAYLLERVWKQLQPDAVPAEQRLRTFVWWGWDSGIPTELWMSVWRNDEMKIFSRPAICALAQDVQNNEEALSEVERIMSDPEERMEHGVFLMAGLVANPTPVAARIAREHLKAFLNDKGARSRTFMAPSAAEVLVKVEADGDREILHEVIASSIVDSEVRKETVQACAKNPKGSDIPAIKKLLDECDDKYVQREVVMELRHYAYEDASPLLYSILDASDKSTWLVGGALSCLRVQYLTKKSKNQSLDRDSIARDRAKLQELGMRHASDPNLKKQIDEVIGCLTRL